MGSTNRLLLTCEHGGNAIPARWRPLFDGKASLLASHRGWDPGALGIARHLARSLKAPLEASTTSRLLVELNRSIGHPALFSEITKSLTRSERERILAEHYFPYREAVEARLRELIGKQGRGQAVLHISVHSFTPELNGEVRNADVALLYDPARRREREFCFHWRAALQAAAPGLRIRMNYPYRGTADGLTTYLRRQFAASRYKGIELEVNQTLAAGSPGQQRTIRRELTESLLSALENSRA